MALSSSSSRWRRVLPRTRHKWAVLTAAGTTPSDWAAARRRSWRHTGPWLTLQDEKHTMLKKVHLRKMFTFQVWHLCLYLFMNGWILHVLCTVTLILTRRSITSMITNDNNWLKVLFIWQTIRVNISHFQLLKCNHFLPFSLDLVNKTAVRWIKETLRALGNCDGHCEHFWGIFLLKKNASNKLQIMKVS